MSQESTPFKLTISMHVLEHLGINLYSNVASVLSEIVANAYDADATEVRIDRDTDADQIVVFDNGIGMNSDEINERFLKVGYQRRRQQPGKTPRSREPMGRKGIGKLSLFSVAKVIKIETVKRGQRSAFVMRLDEIRKRVQENGDVTYQPETVSTSNIHFSHGTRITLSDLQKKQTAATTDSIRRRLARRFTVIGSDREFSVSVDDREITIADRDYYKDVQYLWSYGDQPNIVPLFTKAKAFDRSRALNGIELKISGWLGTVKEVKNLKTIDGENLNKIAIFVRGKMAQEDILADFSERGVYANYLVGELRIDDLDLYDGVGEPDDDAATSSRQRIVEDDPRYIQLKEFVNKELKYIQSQWRNLRTVAGTEKALEIPQVKAWVENLPSDAQTRARTWLGRINRLRIDDESEQRELTKYAVIAFEFHRYHAHLDYHEKIDDENLEGALSTFKEMDNLEMSLYGQIVQQRILVIRTLEEKVDQNAREKAIQQYLFDHLWILDPAWERTESPVVMERPVKQLFEKIEAGLTSDEVSGRVDIAYRKTAGKHVIIELKRPDRRVRATEIINQVQKYRSGIMKILRQQNTPYEPFEFVIVLGADPYDYDEPAGQKLVDDLLTPVNARIVFYEGLLQNANAAYRDYLDRSRQQDFLGELIKAIEDYRPEIEPS